MLKQDDVDRLRRDFAKRLDKLIRQVETERRLEYLSAKTGISMRQLSQWRNPRHVNWPSIKNLACLSLGAGVSLDWLIFGDRNDGHVKRIAGFHGKTNAGIKRKTG